MRRALIQFVLPFTFCLLPVLGAALVAAATPGQALQFYLKNVSESHLDWLILGLGTMLFVMQMYLSWRALRWRGNGFDTRTDHWLNNLAQAAEWFPMLGLIGTVTGILQTFGTLAAAPRSGAGDIIRAYAPAITATGSGLFMALINMFPTWIVLLGRDTILALGGRREAAPPGEARP